MAGRWCGADRGAAADTDKGGSLRNPFGVLNFTPASAAGRSEDKKWPTKRFFLLSRDAKISLRTEREVRPALSGAAFILFYFFWKPPQQRSPTFRAVSIPI